MKKTKLKTVIAAAWFLLAAVIITERWAPADAQTRAALVPTPRKPDMALIDKFDNAVRARFLTQPFFGMSRLAPLTPVKLRSNHISAFMPQGPVEVEAVKSFSDHGWDVGIYLYGRRAEPRVVNGKPKDKYSITYRVNEPLPVTNKLRVGQMQEPKDLIKYVKKAFLEYQNLKAGEPNNFEFDNGDWSYVARPVRAVNESCLKCHNDYVVIDKLPNDQFKLKRREVGEVNGILLYAFRKQM